ncbi:MAG TPA: septal ring lytic transglycosylase RlpA family protein [Thermoanaerobaculia bacterium]|nr:septal ring lytic transglycosylase RlpA family protein [Thermoanaerobaculia bacterium]
MTAIGALLFLAYACATTKPPQQVPEVSHGIASWYGEEFAGRTTANGEIFDPMQFTAAHRTFPFGTVVDVTNPKTSQTVRVRINDRGPYIGQRVIDLSYAAAQQIGLIEPGSGDVDIRVVRVGGGDREPPMPYEIKIQAPTEKAVIASEEAPKIEFPLPSQTAAPSSANDPEFHVELQEQRKDEDVRRQVSADGKTIEEVSRGGVAAIPARRPAREDARRSTARVLKYVVQVGAFSIEANAKLLQAQLARIGQPSFVDHEDLYRVRIGPFATRDQALKVRTSLETSGLSAIIIAE